MRHRYRLQPFPSLGERDFRILWTAMLPGTLAMQMNFFANGYLAFELTGKASSIGLISLGFGIPMILLSLPAGVIADRYSKRMILLISQAVTVVTSLVMAALVLMGEITVYQMALISLFQGTAFVLQVPARQSLITEIVQAQNMLNAIALNSSGFNACRVIGPPFAGWIIGLPWMGVKGTYIIMTLLYTLVIPGLLKIPEFPPVSAKGAKGWEFFVQGISYIRGNPVLIALLTLSFAPIILGMPFQALMPVFAKKIFAVGPTGLGMMMTANGIGAIIGSVTIASFSSMRRPGMVQLALGVFFGLALAIFSVSSSFYVAIPILVVVGTSSASYLALNSTLIMGHSEQRFHGRVMSVYILIFSFMPLGNMIMSLFSDIFGVQAAVGTGAILLAAVVTAFGLLSRPYREI